MYEEDYDEIGADSNNELQSEGIQEEEDEEERDEIVGLKVSKETDDESSVYLTCEEASRSLCMLGKNDSGLKYSYLMINASDKNLTDISVIPTFRNLLFVDVSGNRLTNSSLKVLISMTYLLMLKADRNLIESAEMESMPYLQVLSLNRNEISDTSGISHRLLECLELNDNRIKSVSLNPYVLDNIKVLELRGNLLGTTNGIFFPSLVSLYIADNEIDKIEGIDALVNLKTLHARNNKISVLDGLDNPKCVKLSYVNLRSNRIARFSEIRKLGNLPGLETLVISQNPLTRSTENNNEELDEIKLDGYRIKLIAAIPKLKRINKDPVLEEERDEARELRQRMLEEGTSFLDEDEIMN